MPGKVKPVQEAADSINPRTLSRKLVARLDSVAATSWPGQFRRPLDLGNSAVSALDYLDHALGRAAQRADSHLDSVRVALTTRQMEADRAVAKVARRAERSQPGQARRRKGGGDHQLEAASSEPKTPPTRDRSESPITGLPSGADEGTRVGKGITDFSYENWQLSTEVSADVTTSKETPEGSWQQTQKAVTKATMGVCPDPNGIVSGTFDFTPVFYGVQAAAAPGKVSFTGSLRITGTFVGRVNDAAELVDYDITTISKYTSEATGHETGKQAVDKTLIREGGSATQTGMQWGPSGGDEYTGNIQTAVDANPVVLAGSQALIDEAFLRHVPDLASALVVEPILSRGRDMWRDGECLKLVVEPAGPLVLPYSTGHHIDAVSLRHRQTDETLTYPVTVSGAGVDDLAPVKGVVPFGVNYKTENQRAALASYVGGGGSVTFEAASRRGLVKEQVSWEPIGAGFDVSFETTTSSSLRGHMLTLAYRGFLLELPAPDEGGNTHAGKGSYTVHSTSRRTNCRNKEPDEEENTFAAGPLKATGVVYADIPGEVTVSFTLEPTRGPRANRLTRPFRALERFDTEVDSVDILLTPPMAASVTIKDSLGGEDKESSALKLNPCDGVTNVESRATAEKVE